MSVGAYELTNFIPNDCGQKKARDIQTGQVGINFNAGHEGGKNGCLMDQNNVLKFEELTNKRYINQLFERLTLTTPYIRGLYDVDVESDFIFIGTMNPNDISTENLSDVFLDRFDLIYMGYPENFKIEEKIVTTKGKEIVEFPKKLLDFTIKFVRELRLHDDLEKVPSVRATIGLYERAQANAMLLGRKKVNYQDIESAAISVLTHRIRLKPSVKYLKTPEKVIMETLEKFKEEGDIP